MPRKKRSRTPKRKKATGRRSIFRPWFLHILIILFLVLAAYTLLMERQVREHFEGQRWALPAEVYARPLELYPTLKLSAPQLVYELGLLGYRSVKKVFGHGQYQHYGNKIVLWTRGFGFPDAKESDQQLQLYFQNNRLSSIKSTRDGQSIPLARLEPMLIDKIYPLHNEDRELLHLTDIPENFVKILLTVEDRHFYKHFGLDPIAIGRATIANIRSGKITQGASTLTQQLAKNFYLSSEKRWLRKLNEVLIALILEWHYEKNDILEAYINEIFLGQDGNRAIHGFGEAAWFYFGRPLDELSVAQMSLLVGLARGASYYNPRKHPERATNRRNHIISSLLKRELVSEDQAQRARQSKMGLTKQYRRAHSQYPAFMELLRKQLKEDYRDEDLRTEGLRIFTTLDPLRQHHAEEALKNRILDVSKKKKRVDIGLQGAVIVTGSQNGEIQALVGDKNSGFAGFNRALYARRPIGSLIKPAVYLSAISSPDQFHILTPLEDKPVSWQGEDGKIWQPKNYDSKLHGTVLLKDALAYSYNLATVNLGFEVGIQRVKHTLKTLGVTVPMRDYPSLFLGALELTPLEVAQMYQVFASGGYRIPLRTIRSVQTRGGNLLKYYGLSIERRLITEHAFLNTYMLTNVIDTGTARRIKALLPESLPLAGKTGTTDDLRDSWFVGYGSDVMSVVWIGRDDNKPAGLTGSSGAMRVWANMMKQIQPTPLDMTAPPGIEWRWYDSRQQHFTEANCEQAREYPFLTETPQMELFSCGDSPGTVKGMFDYIKNIFQ